MVDSPETERVLLVASRGVVEKLPDSRIRPMAPALCALVNYSTQDFGIIRVIFDGAFLTISEAGDLLRGNAAVNACIKSGIAFFANHCVYETSSRSPEEAGKIVESIRLYNHLTASSRWRFLNALATTDVQE